jgi:hypothetical protein
MSGKGPRSGILIPWEEPYDSLSYVSLGTLPGGRGTSSMDAVSVRRVASVRLPDCYGWPLNTAHVGPV